MTTAKGLGAGHGDWSAGLFSNDSALGLKASFKHRWDKVWGFAEGRSWYGYKTNRLEHSIVAGFGGEW